MCFVSLRHCTEEAGLASIFEAHVQLFINIYFSMLSKSDEKLGMTCNSKATYERARTGIIEQTRTTLLVTNDNAKGTYIVCYK